MNFNLWFVIAGALFIAMALAGTLVKRLPLTTSFLYLLAGITLGPAWLGLINLSAVRNAELLERITEIAVIISLFTAGLKLRARLTDALWRPSLRLAFGSMTLTVAMVTLVGTLGLGLPLGAAVLLGAILAPTDPVLASDVQVEGAHDRDRLRFSLTGEAGFNDGTAFPFVMLGLGLLGLHDIGALGWRWVAVDVVWAVAGGLGIGALLGMLVGRLVIYLRREHKESVGLDDFLALGLIAFSYGAALMAHTYGFLAVFAAGLALRATERHFSGAEVPAEVRNVSTVGVPEEVATDPEKAPAVMAQAILAFNEQLERIGEVGVVVLVGGMLTLRGMPVEALWFVPLMFFVIRPIAVAVGLIGARVSRVQRGLIAWFGLRGIGSLYYLTYAIAHGLPDDMAQRLSGITLTVMAASIVVHGISVTPLMNFYARPHKKPADGESP
ncbi:MAG TPA: cation:proton antiporter [Abditibacteriaceae bacterium]|nr:cation:proton antiporter [Abditibacteriaceae bacterium]